jgi:hypothetical protein
MRSFALVFEPLGDAQIGLAGFGNPRGVIVREDAGGGVVLHSADA